VLKGSEVRSTVKMTEKKEDEKVDLGYIDLFDRVFAQLPK
jgi:hypothetical protein